MNLAAALSIDDLRRLARRRLPRSVFDFIDGGAEDETTLADNRAAFDRVRLRPRVLQDVRAPALRCEITGTPADAPIVVAPMGSCMLGWPEADIAIARAAASLGLPYTLSTMATTGLERMRSAFDGRLWFQLYVLKEPRFNELLVQRAEAAGCEALVVTLDLPAGGKRERDLRNGLSIPLRPRLRQLWEGLTHPRWSLRLLAAGLPSFENVRGLMDERAGLTIAAQVGRHLDAGWCWDDLARLRDRWRGALHVKGVLHPDDADRLAAMGFDALWVSNHGSRQLDGAVASLDALPAIAAAVRGRCALLLDSGVRRGVDVLKARALGAQAVAVGRAPLWGACAGGEAGARRALQILVDELRLAMTLAGVPSLADADAALVAPRLV